jgi:hypothetical protein
MKIPINIVPKKFFFELDFVVIEWSVRDLNTFTTFHFCKSECAKSDFIMHLMNIGNIVCTIKLNNCPHNPTTIVILGTSTNPLNDFNVQFDLLREHHHLNLLTSTTLYSIYSTCIANS